MFYAQPNQRIGKMKPTCKMYALIKLNNIYTYILHRMRVSTYALIKLNNMN